MSVWAVALLVTGLGSSSVTARADAPLHSLRLEGGLALPLVEEQADRYGLGGGLAAGYELRPWSWLGFEGRFSAYWFPSTEEAPTEDGFGTYYAPALGLRLYPLASLEVPGLWLGAAVPLVFTGDVVRPGIEAGLGYEHVVADFLRAGVFARYHHAFQTEDVDDASDGGFLSFGISLAYPGETREQAPELDRDGDGILDADDGCPDDAEDADGFEDDNGCPDPDNDGDGVLDGADQCATEAEDRDGFEDENGCPDLDNDADGLLDPSDQCPGEAEDRDQYEDDNGCPELDNDSDSIADAEDRCPNEPETRNEIEDTDGCPDEVPQAEQTLGALGARVLFRRGGADILPASRGAIRDVIQLLKEHPEITRIQVEAHASSEGSAEFNQQLSQRRADAVVQALVRGGIDAGRLSSQAFGAQRPEVEGDTEEQRAQNRRAVFTVLERSAATPAPATP